MSTVGLNSSHPKIKKADSNLVVGISYGLIDHILVLMDVNNYVTNSSCYQIQMIPLGTYVYITVTNGLVIVCPTSY